MDPNGPIELISRYLSLCSHGRLEEASDFLSPGATLVAPGGERFTTLANRAEAARQRYRAVRKRIEHWDVCKVDGRRFVVYCMGTLDGEDPYGEPFNNVRFIDRFELVDGLIEKQEVWNDLGYLLWRRKIL